MFGWYYDKNELKNTPSLLDDIDEDTELAYRKEGIKLIVDIGKELKVDLYTIATSAMYFHRFYMLHSFKQFAQFSTACGCFFLATKVHETPKKLNDVINVAHTLLSDIDFSVFEDNPKQQILAMEIKILQTLQFDLEIVHAYDHLLSYMDSFTASESQKNQILHMAWTFVNNSLFTTLVLQWEPEIIAIAFIYLAGKLSELEIENWVRSTNRHLNWWDEFIDGISEEVLEDICHQILDVYSASSDNSNSSVTSSTSSLVQDKEKEFEIDPETNISKNLCYPYSTTS